MVLALDARGHQVTTIEGLGTPANMHPVQAAFVEEDAQQCGFCTPGMVMSVRGGARKKSGRDDRRNQTRDRRKYLPDAAHTPTSSRPALKAVKPGRATKDV